MLPQEHVREANPGEKLQQHGHYTACLVLLASIAAVLDYSERERPATSFCARLSAF